MMMRIASGVLQMDEMTRQYIEYIDNTTQPLKDYLLTLPEGPKLVSSPLHNGKNIVDLDDIMKKIPVESNREESNIIQLKAVEAI
jgi:hypothetical protein